MKHMVKIALIVLTLCITPDGKAQELQVRMIEDLVIGADEHASQAYLFAGIRHIAVDSKGNLYVADKNRGYVSVYDGNGRFLKRIGSRGQGPGELQEIMALAIDADDNLIVLDRLSYRLTRYYNMGDTFESFLLPDDFYISADQMVPFKSTSLVLYYKVYSKEEPEETFSDKVKTFFSGLWGAEDKVPPPGEDVLHLYDFSTRSIQASFAPALDIWNLDEPFLRASAGGPGMARIATDGRNRIYVVPRFYEGVIYRYEQAGAGWEKTILRGKKPPHKTYEPIDIDEHYLNPNRKGVSVAVANTEGRFGARLYNSSEGLFVDSQGRLVHFSIMETDSGPVLGIELFTQNGDFLGYGVCSSVRPDPEKEAIYFKVHAMDGEDRFYASTWGENGFPVVKVFHVEMTTPSVH